MRSASRFVLLASSAVFFAAGNAAAADPPAPAPPTETAPPSTIKTTTASTGTTDIATGGMVTSTAPREDDPSHVTDLNIGAGGLFSSGNARQIALTSLGKLRLRREKHQFSTAATVNYARAGKVGEEITPTIENYQALLRYDYYLEKNISVFFQSTARRDRFQGLDLRLNLDPGLAYYFINEKTHRLQAEAGYDYQHDIRRDASRTIEPTATDPPGTPVVVLDKTHSLHNARLFVGYENKLRKEVSFLTSIEYLQNFADMGTYRLIIDIGLKSQVSDSFSLATTYTARYENKPLPKVESLDSIASVNLVYTFF